MEKHDMAWGLLVGLVSALTQSTLRERSLPLSKVDKTELNKVTAAESL